MLSRIADACCARVPESALPVLADMRTSRGIRVARNGEWAFVRWEQGDERVVERLLAVSAVEFYEQRNGTWHRAGRSLPAFDFPANLHYRPLLEELTPAPLAAVTPPALASAPVPIVLVADARTRPTTTMECGIRELARWADGMPSNCLERLRAAYARGRLLVRGSRLPLLEHNIRYWGERVLVPLGFRLEPAVPESCCCTALNLDPDDSVLFRKESCEIIPAEAFSTLTRAGIRQLQNRGLMR